MSDSLPFYEHVGRGAWSRSVRYWVYSGIEFQYARFADHQFVRHFHDEYQIAVILDGSLKLRVGSEKHRCEPLAITAVNPGEAHAGDTSDWGWECRNFYLPPDFPTQIGLGERRFPTPVIDDPEAARALINAHGASALTLSPLARDTLLVEALTLLFKRHACCGGAGAAARSSRLSSRRAEDYIRAHFAESIRLQTLADISNLSPYHFLRTFRHDIGLTPHAFQNQLRVAYARRRLIEGANAAEAASDAGFADQSHLIRALKRTHGVTPSLIQTDAS